MNPGINAYDINGANNATNTEINDNLFSNIDFGPLKEYLDDDNITDISYSNNGQIWLKSLDKGVYRVDNPGINNDLIEKIAFQCANIMGKTFNMASPFLDSESSELRMNFVHDSIARNGIAVVFRKTPAKIRLKKEKIIADKYITLGIHNFLIDAVRGHCNIIVSGETGSGKTELVKYLASHTAENEKIVTIEDTLELHLDKIFPHRDIVAMKTNNIASYSDVLVTCMRQNPKWILLSEVRSAEAVTAVRNSISSGHNILSTIHADKAESIPYRLYSLLESNIDVNQFMSTIYRYIQLGVHVRARYDKNTGRFMREVCEVCEFYVTHDNVPESHIIYRKNIDGTEIMNPPSEYLIDYLEAQGVDISNKDYSSLDENAPVDNNLSDAINDPKYSDTLDEELIDDVIDDDIKDVEEKNHNLDNTVVSNVENLDNNSLKNESQNNVDEELNNDLTNNNTVPNSSVLQNQPVVNNVIPDVQMLNNDLMNNNTVPNPSVEQSQPVVNNVIPDVQMLNNDLMNNNMVPNPSVEQNQPVVNNVIPNVQMLNNDLMNNNMVPNPSVEQNQPVVNNVIPDVQMLNNNLTNNNMVPNPSVGQSQPVENYGNVFVDIPNNNVFNDNSNMNFNNGFQSNPINQLGSVPNVDNGETVNIPNILNSGSNSNNNFYNEFYNSSNITSN